MEGCPSSTSPILRIFGCNRSNMAMYLGHEGFIAPGTVFLRCLDFVANGILWIHLPGKRCICVPRSMSSEMGEFRVKINDNQSLLLFSQGQHQAGLLRVVLGLNQVNLITRYVVIFLNRICNFDPSYTLRACLRASSRSSSLVSLSTFFRKAST